MPPETSPVLADPATQETRLETPVEITAELIEQLVAGEEVPEAVPSPPALAAPPLPAPAPPAPPGAAPELAALIASLPQAIAQGVAVALRSGPGVATPEKTASSIVERLKRSNPTMDEGQAQWLADTIGTILEDKEKAGQERLARLEGVLAQNLNQQTAQQFLTWLDLQMDRLGIPRSHEDGEEAWERTTLRDHVVQQTIRLGPQATPEAAARILRQINERRLRGQPVSEQQAAAKKQAAENAPPLAHVKGNATAVASFRRELTDPKNKQMHFRGDKFTKAVTGYINELLGGRKT